MTRALSQPRKMSLTDPRHLMRFLKSQAKMSLEDIAKAEGVSVATVRDSIRMVEQYQAQSSTAEMDFAIRHMVRTIVPKAGETLEGLLGATELVTYKDPKTGKEKLREREDKTTRIEAVKIVAELVKNVQPKAPATEVNVNQTTQVANLSAAETTEERMRRLRKMAAEHNQLPPEVAGVPESIDKGDQDDDSYEDEEEESGEEEEGDD